MQIYLVGGAVRDELLNIPVIDRDWVVVGSSPDEMLAQDFDPVGKEFPVFLHPDTHEEYALARTERKTGKGYKGFVFHADASVTLEEDLQRRDLTINAIAKDDAGNLIDPYQGQQDLKNKVLRHVSPAFAEDPVRILRLARFAAKLPEFSIDEATNQLMCDMVTSGEVDALVAERVWKELRRALSERSPQRFFNVLKNCGALKVLFPPLASGAPKINITTFTESQRFAVLLSECGINDIKALCIRYRVPAEFSDLARLTHLLAPFYQKLKNGDASCYLSYLKRCDALRKPERFVALTDVLAHLYNVNHLSSLQQALDAVKAVDTAPLLAQKLKGKDFAKALEVRQLEAIASNT
ncbi:MAG: multifunctional CCA tRNA nucleotidyl transferase/2'3'-cyclic phosphodiesterase/2'nucleotidase/phosphatase [Coxiella sp. (in: Bacteria)]|nr:MAG: multifunctional CCA tRNA nucleotidyl transferase/2'3'-cyclic phosphodiesterase/2'nucleotidase/phosphatase [Coxiella sp. (in: g-proteobacteria)]